MYEIIRNLIITPYISLLAIIVTWGVLHILLVKCFKLKDVFWARLEYFWIIVGILGLLSIVDENRKQVQINKLKIVNYRIENESESLFNFTKNEIHCIKYIRSDWLPKEEFEKRQAHSDFICNWVKEVSRIVEKSIKNGYIRIEKLPKLKFLDKEKEFSFKEIMRRVNLINSNIGERDVLRKDIGNTSWRDFKYTFGILLLILAFSIRLTLVSKKVNTLKKTKQ